MPAFALPGQTVWAMGLHAGVRERFKAEVIKLAQAVPSHRRQVHRDRDWWDAPARAARPDHRLPRHDRRSTVRGGVILP